MTMSAPAPDDIPAGFEPLATSSPYLGMMAPLYFRPEPNGCVVIALRLDKQHTNMRGIAHGGMLVTLADSALGRNVSNTRKPRQPMVTVSMATDFLNAVHVGDWLEAHVQVNKHGARLSFAECLLKVGDRVVLRASGVFATVAPAGANRDDGND